MRNTLCEQMFSASLPNSDRARRSRHFAFVPIPDFMHCSNEGLFDHLVGPAEQRRWDGETERLCGLEVYNQLDLRRLHDRQVGRLLALEYFPGVVADQTIIFRFIASVADYTAGRDKRAILEIAGTAW